MIMKFCYLCTAQSERDPSHSPDHCDFHGAELKNTGCVWTGIGKTHFKPHFRWDTSRSTHTFHAFLGQFEFRMGMPE